MPAVQKSEIHATFRKLENMCVHVKKQFTWYRVSF